ncbi:helix-turn-helix transcriptional regulator [Schaalia sp. lx-260]|uniref:helix-turn-helix transcriptional regulator n=1 Tax=Schaalia sp. lx-260 TaxID=2899082 RepID=UPI001E5F0D64|nr:transcriptional regulator [Schaalia sp. lx-260]MCD4549708.1 transcriptional regulator [Schaalia sp. lx-260]
MSARYLSLHGVSQHLGLAYTTVRSYLRDKRLPEPDVIIGEAPAETFGWSIQTIDAWQANRPGKPGRPSKNKE